MGTHKNWSKAATSSKSMGENLDEWFKLRSQRSTVGREVLAGCVNYLVTVARGAGVHMPDAPANRPMRTGIAILSI